MSFDTNSVKRISIHGVLLGALALLVVAFTAQAASASVYEGEAAAIAYHEGNTGNTGFLRTGEYSGESWKPFYETPPQSGANTSPSVQLACPGCAEQEAYTGAVNATTGTLWTKTWFAENTAWTNSGVGYSSHTSPSVSNFSVAFNAAGTAHLRIYNASTHSNSDTGLVMAAETSPSITNCRESACWTAINGSNGHLWIYPLNATAWDTGLGMAAGTSPSIIKSGGVFYVAFHAAGSNHLWIYNASNRTAVDTGFSIETGSSPSVIAWGGYLVAFEAAGSSHLGLYQSGSSTWIDTGGTMQRGSSPSITARCSAGCHWDVALQAVSTHYLWTDSETAGYQSSGIVLGEHSSPSISGGVE